MPHLDAIRSKGAAASVVVGQAGQYVATKHEACHKIDGDHLIHAWLSDEETEPEAPLVRPQSSTVFEPFDRLQGRQAVTRLTKALEPPRLSGRI